ncbi:EamA family transporter [Blastococcus sp. TF02-8]|uniref:DMT family transporter n=1 Tax=Blastococcus sp. TF02-8 TaxID=2250574 RepID=UPI000E0289E3|nr:DMT family transporter [Blastococcus sp. TF02-8]RBY98055.1 EamA family transporter [Blastococcus sp. TF02-8]
MRGSDQNALGMAGAAASSIAVGSTVAASGVLLDYPVLGGQALRYLLGGLLLAMLFGRRLPPVPRTHLFRLALLGATGMAGFNVLLIAALGRAGPGAVGAIIGAVPVVLALAGPLLRRRLPAPRVLLAAVLVSAGAAIVQWAGGASILGIVLAIGAMLCEVAFSLLALSLLPDLGAAGVATFASLTAAGMLALVAVTADGTAAFRMPTRGELLAIVYLAVVVTAAAFVLWYSSLMRIPVELAGLFAGLIPVSALLTSAAVGATGIDAVQLGGVLVTGAGVALGALHGGRVTQEVRE